MAPGGTAPEAVAGRDWGVSEREGGRQAVAGSCGETGVAAWEPPRLGAVWKRALTADWGLPPG